MEGIEGREGGRKEGENGMDEGKGRNWMPVLAPQDHPGDQDRQGASPRAPSTGAPGPSGR